MRVSRQSSSGTYEFFREHALGNKDFRLGSRDLNGSKEVVELVGSTLTAIGYSGMGYATPAVKMLKVAKAKGEPAISPTVAAVHDKSYPLARSLHVYTLGEPQGAVKAYIDWILSDAGQKIVEDSGYVPVPPDAAPEALRHRPRRAPPSFARGRDRTMSPDSPRDSARFPRPVRPRLGRRSRSARSRR